MGKTYFRTQTSRRWLVRGIYIAVAGAIAACIVIAAFSQPFDWLTAHEEGMSAPPFLITLAQIAVLATLLVIVAVCGIGVALVVMVICFFLFASPMHNGPLRSRFKGYDQVISGLQNAFHKLVTLIDLAYETVKFKIEWWIRKGDLS